MCDKLTKLRDILSGKTPIGLNLEFLYMHNKADLQVRQPWGGCRGGGDTLAHLEPQSMGHVSTLACRVT